MEKVESAYAAFSDCDKKKIRAIDDMMDVLGGKWKVPIIARLWYKPRRFSELLRDISGISGKVLSRELQDLEMNQLINRAVSPSKPVSVTYEISEYGRSIKDLTDSIADWGVQHRSLIVNSGKQS